MEFSSLIDVSSFFIGVLINLLLIALICYYFKRKFDNIEMAQSEQAKIIYNLIETRQQAQQQIQSKESSSGLSFFNQSDLDKLDQSETKDVIVTKMFPEDGDSDSDTDTDDDDHTVTTESEEEADDMNAIVDHANVEVDVIEETNVDEIKTVDISGPEEEIVEEPIAFEKSTEVDEHEESEHEEIISEYEKMTVKELREALNMKGYHVKSNMKKSEMLELLQTPIEEPVVVLEEETIDETQEDPVIELDE